MAEKEPTARTDVAAKAGRSRTAKSAKTPAKAATPAKAPTRAKAAASKPGASVPKAPRKPAAKTDGPTRAAVAPRKTGAASKTAKPPAAPVSKKRPAKVGQPAKKTQRDPKSAPAKQARPAKAARGTNAKRSNTRKGPAFLAVELGTPVDPQGEPIGAGSPRAQSDQDLQTYALQLWRQMQRGSVTKRYLRSIEAAGLTPDEIWTAGLREVWTTASTADEMRRYRQKMLFRANLLEAILSETVADLHRLEGIEPRDARDAAIEPPDEPAAVSSQASTPE